MANKGRPLWKRALDPTGLIIKGKKKKHDAPAPTPESTGGYVGGYTQNEPTTMLRGQRAPRASFLRNSDTQL